MAQYFPRERVQTPARSATLRLLCSILILNTPLSSQSPLRATFVPHHGFSISRLASLRCVIIVPDNYPPLILIPIHAIWPFSWGTGRHPTISNVKPRPLPRKGTKEPVERKQKSRGSQRTGKYPEMIVPRADHFIQGNSGAVFNPLLTFFTDWPE